MNEAVPTAWRKTWNIQDDGEFEDEWIVYEAQPYNNHTWAFIHYLRRRGDKVIVRCDYIFLDIAIKRKTDA